MPGNPSLTAFAGQVPPWSLPSLDANFTNVAALLKDVGNYEPYITDTGAANAYAITYPGTITFTLQAGVGVTFKAANANTGASTLAVNGGAAKNVLNPDGSALYPGQIPLNGIVHAVYDGAQWLLTGGNPSGGLRKIQVFTANGTYTPTAGMKFARVIVIGGGGGGGGAAPNGAGAGSAAVGGAAGGAAIKVISAATIGASQTVTIGGKGTGGAAGANPGTNGGTTSFGAIISATGGGAGAGAVSTAGIQPTEAVGGPSGGVGTGGDVNITGAPGCMGFQFPTANRAAGGMGGSSIMGGGAPSPSSSGVSNGNSAAATAYGAGGSGAHSLGASGATAGGDGCAGICFVEEYF